MDIEIKAILISSLPYIATIVVATITAWGTLHLASQQYERGGKQTLSAGLVNEYIKAADDAIQYAKSLQEIVTGQSVEIKLAKEKINSLETRVAQLEYLTKEKDQIISDKCDEIQHLKNQLRPKRKGEIK